jgi:hypothetical protein
MAMFTPVTAKLAADASVTNKATSLQLEQENDVPTEQIKTFAEAKQSWLSVIMFDFLDSSFGVIRPRFQFVLAKGGRKHAKRGRYPETSERGHQNFSPRSVGIQKQTRD